MSKRRGKRGQKRRRHGGAPKEQRRSSQRQPGPPSSSLEQHSLDKQTRKLKPPLLGLAPKMVPVEWEPNLLPEMLWLASLMKEDYPDRGAFHAALSALDELIPDDGPCLDGTLSAFAIVPEEARAEARKRFVEAGALTPEFANALALYPECPAAWLLDDWHEHNSSDPNAGERYLKAMVLRLRDGRTSYASQLRSVVLFRMAENGKLAISPTVKSLLLLKDYPRGLNVEDRLRCEASVRSFFLVALSQPHHPTKQGGWAATFWRQNWKLSVCERAAPIVLTEDDEPDENIAEGPQLRSVAEVQAEFLEATTRLGRELKQLQDQAEPDLFDPVSDEARMGLASRQSRLFRRLVEEPNLWTDEQGPHLLRSMIDTRIVSAWLVSKNDPELYRRFKEYGQGKLKLLKLHFEKHGTEQGFAETSADYLAYLDARVNEERSEEFQAISLKPNFADRSIRQMAEDVGLKPLYDLEYAPLSGESHGDWSSLVTHDLERCANPLHRYHRLGRFDADEEALRIDYLLHAFNLMADTITDIFESYGLSAAAAIDTCRERFIRALRPSEEPEARGDVGHPQQV